MDLKIVFNFKLKIVTFCSLFYAITCDEYNSFFYYRKIILQNKKHLFKMQCNFPNKPLSQTYFNKCA